MRVIVTGSRTWDEPDRIYSHLELLGIVEPLTVVHGACPQGADYYAHIWAKGLVQRRGYEVTEEPYPADWERYPRAAGVLRNELMVSKGADVCLVYLNPCYKPKCKDYPHPSHGAENCMFLAQAAGIEVIPYWSQHWTDTGS